MSTVAKIEDVVRVVKLMSGDEVVPEWYMDSLVMSTQGEGSISPQNLAENNITESWFMSVVLALVVSTRLSIPSTAPQHAKDAKLAGEAVCIGIALGIIIAKKNRETDELQVLERMGGL